MKLLAICLMASLTIGCCGTRYGQQDLSQGRCTDYAESFDSDSYWPEQYACAKMSYSFTGSTHRDFRKWQKVARPELKRILGVSKIEQQLRGYKPKAQLLESEDVGFAIRERWELWTEPDVPLPLVLLRPKDMKEGEVRPLMITPHGHGKNTEVYAGVYTSVADSLDAVVGERNVAVQAVEHGFIAIAPTTRAFGKTRTNHGKEIDEKSSCHIQLLHDLLVGRTPIGDRVWDMSRIIDWALETQPVDSRNIIMSGNSGGGTITLFAGACEPRITISVPGSAFSTFQGSIGVKGHCECNYVPGLLEFGETWDVAGLTAPRAFCAVHGVKDTGFPIVESRKAIANAKKIYEAAGVPENCELYEGSEGHRYYKAGVWDFIERHLVK